MARPPATTTIVRTFHKALDSSAGLAAAATPYCVRTYDGFRTNPLHPNQARRVIALSFLAASAAWDEFLEAVFVRYVAGAASPSGYRPTLLMGKAPSLDHAFKLVSGKHDYDPESRFLNWGPDETLARLRLFCRPGSAFENAIAGATRQLKDAAVLRNRVAHASQKCRADFIKTAKRLLGKKKLSQGYGVGDFLLVTPRLPLHDHAVGDTYFLAYLNLFQYLARTIAPQRGG